MSSCTHIRIKQTTPTGLLRPIGRFTFIISTMISASEHEVPNTYQSDLGRRKKRLSGSCERSERFDHCGRMHPVLPNNCSILHFRSPYCKKTPREPTTMGRLASCHSWCYERDPRSVICKQWLVFTACVAISQPTVFRRRLFVYSEFTGRKPLWRGWDLNRLTSSSYHYKCATYYIAVAVLCCWRHGWPVVCQKIIIIIIIISPIIKRLAPQ